MGVGDEELVVTVAETASISENCTLQRNVYLRKDHSGDQSNNRIKKTLVICRKIKCNCVHNLEQGGQV